MDNAITGLALDIGTSGIRGQLLDIAEGKVLRSYIMSRNPIPGSNIMDHLTFAIEHGVGKAKELLLRAVNDIIVSVKPENLRRISVCGNPVQLSLFEGIEIKDLAYAGENKLRSENIRRADRTGRIISGDAIGLSQNIEVMIPPAVRHEIGADALAMMLKSGFLDDDMCMVTDYGTNAEMALKVGDSIYTGSAAAGPALEGQHTACGMLAGPGALSDLIRTGSGWIMKVLDEDLNAQDGPILNIRSNIVKKQGTAPAGITGTGMIALIHAGMQDDRIDPPKIKGNTIDIGRNLYFGENDLKEAGKAIGAIRAGHLTLMKEADINIKDISTMYMAGAAGTYVDPVKAKSVGMVPAHSKRIVQAGNTSLELAKDLVFMPEKMDELNGIAKEISAKHVMFSASPVFSRIYVLELAYWTEGMPLHMYKAKLSSVGIEYPDGVCETETERKHAKDISDTGDSLKFSEPKTVYGASWDCRRCMICVRSCPEKALSLSNGRFIMNTGRCLGSACCVCETRCKDRIFRRSDFILL
ncbi:MAG: methylamine methyltransferase corrinoid protein reductive activase [Methanomassiliicoccaceae archaeon]|nr:methylamine methyltransferase corrinoid protein reductive activase [Methanomassiliicoccaceae archaeon]